MDARNYTRRVPLIIASIAVVLGAAVLMPAGTNSVLAAGQVSVSPASALRSSTITLSGSGFPANRVGLITWDWSIAGMPTAPTNANGSFSVSLVVPSNATFGSHNIQVKVWENSGPPVIGDAVVNVTSEPSTTPTTAPTATQVPSATATQTTAPTSTATATAVPTSTATSTAVPPTSTPGAEPPVANQLCPAWLHDSYKTTGPDGNLWPTWHPQRDPTYDCYFDHEHGDNPATSAANNTPPAFGYFDGGVEPHPGFKVAVVNAGYVNDEGSTALHSSRVVFHMGTGGPNRFDTRFHSMQVDVVGQGLNIHYGGMADTGGVGSICANPRQGKTVMATTGCQTDSSYEIWEAKLSPASGYNLVHSHAAFDPITAMNPVDHTQLVVRPNAHGCDREFYMGPYVTPQTDFGPSTGGLGYIATYKGGEPLTQFKYQRNYCAPGLGLKN